MATPPLSSFLPFLLFLLISSLLLSPASALKCNNHDEATLLKVKQEWGNPPDLRTWVRGTDCCTWDFISCRQDGHVSSLRLADAEISAPISASLGDLSALVELVIYTVDITGSIPPSFAKLSNLMGLGIDATAMSGSIPRFLSRLTNLTIIALMNSHFSGPIPPTLSKLPKLHYIDLSGNRFTGTIPPGLLHGTDASLRLSNNDLTGGLPESFGDADIDAVDLSNNRLEFDFTRVRFTHNISHLDLSHNRIYGRVPKSLKDQRKLVQLNLSYNRLCGEIPKGGAMANFSADSYLHNKCLCGTPLPPCRKLLGK